MKPRNGRPWNRAEKILILAPLLVVGIWWSSVWLRTYLAPHRITVQKDQTMRVRLCRNARIMLVAVDQWFRQPTGGSSYKTVSIAVHDAKTGARRQDLPHLLETSGWDISPDGKDVVFYDKNSGVVRRMEIESGRILWESRVGIAPTWLTFAHDGRTLFGKGGTISVWDAATGTLLHSTAPNVFSFGKPRLGSDRQLFYLTWPLRFKGKPIGKVNAITADVSKSTERVVMAFDDNTFDYAVSSRQRWLARCSYSRRKREGEPQRFTLWDIAERKKQWSLILPPNSNAKVNFSPSENTLVIAINAFQNDNSGRWSRGSIGVYDTTTGRMLWKRPTHQWVRDPFFANQNAIVYSEPGNSLDKVVFHNATTGRILHEVEKDSITWFGLTSDLKTLVIEGGQQVRMIDVSNLQLKSDEK